MMKISFKEFTDVYGRYIEGWVGGKQTHSIDWQVWEGSTDQKALAAGVKRDIVEALIVDTIGDTENLARRCRDFLRFVAKQFGHTQGVELADELDQFLSLLHTVREDALQ